MIAGDSVLLCRVVRLVLQPRCGTLDSALTFDLPSCSFSFGIVVGVSTAEEIIVRLV